MNRPYTGYDTNSRGPLPGTVALRDLILFLNAGKLTHLGTYAKRDARGSSAAAGYKGGSGVVILKYPDAYTITIGAGLTGSTAPASGGFKVTTITAGSGNVSWA